MMDVMERFESTCHKKRRRIVLPESDDPRILKAAASVSNQSLARPVLIGTDEKIETMGKVLDLELAGIEVVDPSEHPNLDSYLDEYMAMRENRNITRRIATRVLSKDLHLASMMVRMGEADGVVAGARNLTSSVIKAGKMFIGLEDGISEPSSFFIMDVPGRGQMVFADCAVNPNPDSKLLAEIAISSASSAKRLLSVEPHVAMLSFSTKGSADHPDVRKVAEATEIVVKSCPNLIIDGEIQADAALVPDIARRKKAVRLGGRANVLIFPDLDAGNIAYKLIQHLGKAKAYGPFLQGFRRPINDLSRGCTVEEVVGAILVTSIQAGKMDEDPDD